MGLSKMLRSASARPTWLNCQRSAVLLPHLRCLDGYRSEIPLPQLCSALTAKDLMFRFRTSALPWLPKIWSSTSELSFCTDCQKCEVIASALPLCLDCQIREVLLSHFRSALTGKDLKFHFPHLYCQDFQRCEVPLLHFISAWTSKDLQFRFCTFAQSWLPKLWRSASPLTLCLHCQIWEVPPPHFPSALTAKEL